MTDSDDNGALEAARARLDLAMSRLNQEVSISRSALESALALQAAAADKDAGQAERVQALEQENLRLHEQIATLSLQEAGADPSEGAAKLEAENEALKQNYDLLKRQYTNLQDEHEGLQDRMANMASSSTGGDQELQKQVNALASERDEIKSELDSVIKELEAFMAESDAAVGGVN